jgi:hypothetical protein
MVDPAEADREYRAEAASSALELASHAYLAVEPDLREDIAEYPLEYALDVLSYLEALQSATRTVRKQVEEYVAEQLKPATYYRHRDSVVKVGGSGSWKVKEETVNNGTLAALIREDWPQAVNLKAQGAVTKTRITELATARVNPELPEKARKEAVEGIIHYFFEYQKNDSAISLMPVDKAPKYAQALPEGERYIPKPKKPAKPRLEAGE